MYHVTIKFSILLVALLVSTSGCNQSEPDSDHENILDTIMIKEMSPVETTPDSMKNIRKTTYFASDGTVETRRKLLEETFNHDGKLISETRFPVGSSPTIVKYSYDSQNYLTKQEESGPKGLKIKEFDITYDSRGQMVEVHEKGSGFSRKVSYLDDGQRMEESFLGSSLQQRIVYDSNDNILQEYSPGVDIGIVRVFDEFGSLIEERTEFAEGHEVKRFENQYDDEGHLIEVRVDGKMHLRQSFDEKGRLVKRKEYGFGSQLMGVWEYVYE